MSDDYKSLAHSKWDCKYHVVFIPKCRKKKLFGKIRQYLGPVFHELARQKGSKIIEGHMMPDHARQFNGRKRNFNGEKLWARGYAVSTVGFELDQVRKYIRHQNDRDKAEEQGNF